MKNSLFPAISDLRFFVGRKADAMRIVRPNGAFGNKKPSNLYGDTSTRSAVARIVSEGERCMKNALAGLTDESNPILPSNWGVRPNSLISKSRDGWYRLPDEDMERVARTGGWMRAMTEIIKENPGWFKRAANALAKAPWKGINFPSNKKVWSMTNFLTGRSMDRWKTPGRAFRAISSGVARAKEILAPFGITNIPWTVIMDELSETRGPKRRNKIGMRLAINTLSHHTQVPVENRTSAFGQFKGFRYDAWRKMSPEFKGFYRMKMTDEAMTYCNIDIPPIREDDGVKMFVCYKSKVGQHQIAEGWVIKTAYRNSGKKYFVGLDQQTVIISPTGRSFHLPWMPSYMPPTVMVQYSQSQQWGEGGFWSEGSKILYVPIGHEVSGPVSAKVRYWQRFAVRFAEKAWMIQDATLKSKGLEFPENATVLVWVRDSLAAGNCRVGTKMFMEERGWSHRKFIPAEWLRNTNNPRAHAALKIALSNFWALQDSLRLAS